MSWHVQNKELFKSIKKEIEKNYPTLILIIEKDIVYVRGSLNIHNNKDQVLDSFVIEMEIPQNFPHDIPVVREIGGRIPKIADRHFNKNDNTACLCVRDEIFKYWPDGESSIKHFIEVLVKPFFAWQSFFELTGKSCGNERGHGVDGIIEYYTEILETSDIAVIRSFMEYLVHKKIKKPWLCYCGSGKRISDCNHLTFFLEYKRKIKNRKRDIKKSLEELKTI